MDIGDRSNAQRTERLPLLPGEIMEEILSRLPVKSLLKFRCVSKSWRSLIDSKRFVRIHLENSRRNPTFAHHRVIVNSCVGKPCLRYCSLQSLVSESVTHSLAYDDPVFDTESYVRIVGCCNGLICILIDRKHFYLWNPSLRMSRKLPFIESKLKHGYITKYGFGFDESTGDYKVYGILSVFWTTGRFEAVGKVYSLRTNSWNRIVDNFGDSFGVPGKFVNGKLHWGRNYGCNWEWEIISFDLSTEEYGTVQAPSNLVGDFHPSLGQLGGSLCMLCDYRGVRLDVWVMKQYGVAESWRKMATIPHPNNPEENSLSFIFYMGGNREIFLFFVSSFLIYNQEDNEVYPAMSTFDSFREPEVYVESLVSLVMDGEEEWQT